MTHWDTLQWNVTVKGKVTSEPANYILHCCSLSAAMRVASCLYAHSSCSLHPSIGSEYQWDERSLFYSTDMGSTCTALLPFLSSTACGQLVKILVCWEPGHQSRYTAVALAMANFLLSTWRIMYWEMYMVNRMHVSMPCSIDLCWYWEIEQTFCTSLIWKPLNFTYGP